MDRFFWNKNCLGQKTRFLENEPRKLLKTQHKATLIAKNEPKNEAGKLLKKRSCGKNEPRYVFENTRWLKTNRSEFKVQG
jgi:hypothetical protein